MLHTSESEIQMQLVVDGRPINTSVPLNLVACICEDDTFRSEFLRRFEYGDDGSERFKWTFDATKLLIEKYKCEMESFHNPSLEKHLLWSKIASEMQEEGHNVTGYMCDKKFRTLKTSYKLIKEKMKAGRTRRHWEYFKLMDDLYASNIAIRSKISMTTIPDLVPLQSVYVQTSFSNFHSDTSASSCGGSESILSSSSILERLSKICGDASNTGDIKRLPPRNESKPKQEEINSDLDVYKKQLLDIERERLREFRRFNDTYSRIATALEEKNSLYQQYLDNRE